MADGSNARKRVSGWRMAMTDGHATDALLAYFKGTEVFRYTATTMTVARALVASSTLAVTGTLTAAALNASGLITAAVGVVATTGGLTASSPAAAGKIGYSTGAGGTVTQITNRSTGVTMVPNPCLSGTIQTDTTSLGAELSAAFIVTNSAVAIGDTVVASIQSGSNGGNTDVTVVTVTNGTFTLRVSNNNAAAGTAETGAIIINFAIIKAVSA